MDRVEAEDLLYAIRESVHILGASLSYSDTAKYVERAWNIVEQCPECLYVFSDILNDMGSRFSSEEKLMWLDRVFRLVERDVENAQQIVPMMILPGATTGVAATAVNMTVTNVVIHYIKTSEVAEMAVPVSQETAIVNVMAEVAGGAFAVPDSWVSNYPDFVNKFGKDFSAALVKPTGKVDAAGNAMFVWQDFVAGTDPTDETDVFKASITLVDGAPIVSYTPELSSVEAAKRTYKTYAKERISDVEWTDVTELTPTQRMAYNFFKVTVEMK